MTGMIAEEENMRQGEEWIEVVTKEASKSTEILLNSPTMTLEGKNSYLQD